MSSNLPFYFKQFKVNHDICGMKIGVDGVLLGAWTTFINPLKILDVGTGSGLIALMMAQKFPSAKIYALDINSDAILQSKQNISESPFKNDFVLIQQDFLSYSPKVEFDIIVSNLPYHPKNDSVTDLNRAQARFSEFLPLVNFLTQSAKLISPNGTINLIYPVEHLDQIKTICENLGLYIQNLCYVKGNQNVKAKRLMVCLSKNYIEFKEKTLIIESERHQKTIEYDALTKDFYL